MKEITVEAKIEKLDEVLILVDTILEENDCDMKTQMLVDVSVEEIFVNIAHYAYVDKEGEARVEVDVLDSPKRISITFIDSGVPYNPLAKEDPDITLPAEERPIGGLGIFMVKKNADEISYEYKDGKNVLVFIKNI